MPQTIPTLMICVALSATMANGLHAQTGRGRLVGAARALFPKLGIALREDVSEELELVPEQVAKLRELQNQTRQQGREMFTEWRDQGITDRKEIQDQIAEFRARQSKNLNEILLPHQSKRFDQIYFQFRALARGGIAAVLANDDEVAAKIGLNATERHKTKQLSTRIQAELEAKIRRLRQQAEESLLRGLTPDQRKRVENLIGPPFDFRGGELKTEPVEDAQ